MNNNKHQRSLAKLALPGLLALGLTGTLFAVGANAAVEVTGVTGNSATASIDSYNDCGYEFIMVTGADNKTLQAPGAPANVSSAYVFGYKYDWCNNSDTMFFGWSDNVNFKMNASLTKASLSASFTAYEYSTTSTCGNYECPLAITIDATWIGSGDMSAQSYDSSYNYGPYRYKSTSRGVYRDAQSAINLNGGTWSVNSPAAGYMGTNNSHSVSITKP